MITGCPDCFKEQRSINDILAETIIDAQKFANKENVTVAVLQEGQGFIYQAFAGSPPGGTRKVIVPVR